MRKFLALLFVIFSICIAKSITLNDVLRSYKPVSSRFCREPVGRFQIMTDVPIFNKLKDPRTHLSEFFILQLDNPNFKINGECDTIFIIEIDDWVRGPYSFTIWNKSNIRFVTRLQDYFYNQKNIDEEKENLIRDFRIYEEFDTIKMKRMDSRYNPDIEFSDTFSPKFLTRMIVRNDSVVKSDTFEFWSLDP